MQQGLSTTAFRKNRCGGFFRSAAVEVISQCHSSPSPRIGAASSPYLVYASSDGSGSYWPRVRQIKQPHGALVAGPGKTISGAMTTSSQRNPA